MNLSDFTLLEILQTTFLVQIVIILLGIYGIIKKRRNEP